MEFLNQGTPNIIGKNDGIFVKKENGTQVEYFLFDHFEIHTNIIPAGCVQDWHAHKKIEEIIVINSGILFLEWLEDDICSKEITSGQMIRMNNSIHRISNICESKVECTIFRFVAPNENQAEIIKNDKRIYSEEEIKKLIEL